MSGKTDRTKQHIIATFFEMMNEMGFEQIRVSTLAKRAEINRGTFYHHFMDKEDIIEEVEGEIKDSFRELMGEMLRMRAGHKKTPRDGMNGSKATQQMFETSCLLVMKFLYERRDITTILVGKNGRPQFIEELGDIYCDMISANVEVEFPGEAYQLNYLQGFVFSGMLATVKSWLRNGAKESPEEISRLLSINLATAPVRIYDDEFWEQGHLLN